MKLGVNIDHVATIRKARETYYPDIVEAALEAEKGGADFITVHLREDRRHIVDSDLPRLMGGLSTFLNLEMAATSEMQAIALKTCPKMVCIVPEKRKELTTEGGLDVSENIERLREFCSPLIQAGIEVSLFIDPTEKQIDAAYMTGVPTIELHTGVYAANGNITPLIEATRLANQRELKINAGHGLHRDNIIAITQLPLAELNIGHSIIARALFIGMAAAVKEIKNIILNV